MDRVLVIDDHRVFSELLSLALDASEGTECVAIATSIQEGLLKAVAYAVDVVVVDVRLPDGSGLDCVPRLRGVLPGARIIVLTAHPRADLAERALEAGASAFVAKDVPLADLLAAIRQARPTAPVVTASFPVMPAGAGRLTARELEVLEMLARGQDATEIARVLALSVYTVRDHVKAILGKLQARTQLAAVTTAITLGIVDPGSR